MSDAILVQMTTQLLWIVVMLALPIVLTVAVVSLVIGLLQALTQLQDQSLQFIFKLISASIAILATYHWISLAMLNYSNTAFQYIAMMRR